MNLRSDSFRPWHFLDARLAMGRPDPTSRAAFAGNRNPHLAWEGVPERTRSLALWCVDGDAPCVGTDVNQADRTVPIALERVDFHHWAVADLPPHVAEIPEGSHSDGVTVRGKAPGPTPHGGRQGLNDYTGWFAGDATLEGRWAGYDGPFPPWNDERIHAYRFTVVALDVPRLPLPDDFDGPALRRAVNGHVLAAARLTALYAINPKAKPGG
jgi:Raf kinase inhibitor-like YbhB/YbcL family protein